jgi:hypothetical protein
MGFLLLLDLILLNIIRDEDQTPQQLSRASVNVPWFKVPYHQRKPASVEHRIAVNFEYDFPPLPF